MKEVYIAFHPTRVFCSKEEAEKYQNVFHCRIKHAEVIKKLNYYDLYYFSMRDGELTDHEKEVVDEFDDEYFDNMAKIDYTSYGIEMTFKVEHESNFPLTEKDIKDLFRKYNDFADYLTRMGYSNADIAIALNKIANNDFKYGLKRDSD